MLDVRRKGGSHKHAVMRCHSSSHSTGVCNGDERWVSSYLRFLVAALPKLEKLLDQMFVWVVLCVKLCIMTSINFLNRKKKVRPGQNLQKERKPRIKISATVLHRDVRRIVVILPMKEQKNQTTTNKLQTYVTSLGRVTKPKFKR